MDRAFQFLYHIRSIAVAEVFRFSYWLLGKDSRITKYLLSKYRSARRKLPGGIDPQTGRSTRFGAFEAYLTTRDGLGSHVPDTFLAKDLLSPPDFRKLKGKGLKNGTGVIKAEGGVYHFMNGLAHRTEDDGPAVTTEEGQYYYLNGRLHRDRGPAIIYRNGNSKFFRNGVEIPFDRFFETASSDNKKSLVWYIGLKDGR